MKEKRLLQSVPALVAELGRLRQPASQHNRILMDVKPYTRPYQRPPCMVVTHGRQTKSYKNTTFADKNLINQ